VFDRQIREEIMDAFTRDEDLDAEDVSVRAEDGVVTLSGTVEDRRMVAALEETIQSVPGVERVINDLRLRS
jgi:osmotically-inducible protein OsmY